MKADQPIDDNGFTMHSGTQAGVLAPYCLLMGAKGRSKLTAEQFFTDAKMVGNDDYRDYTFWTGKCENMPISVVTHGVGGPSLATIIEEAWYSGARRFIRVGTCAAIQPDPVPGDLAIWTGAVRLDGATDNWAMKEYPAVADFRVTHAIVEAAQRLGFKHHIGIGATIGDFWIGQNRPGLVPGRRIPKRIQQRHQELLDLGVEFYAMEEAALFVWSSIQEQVWSGVVSAILANRQTNELEKKGEEDAIRVALLAMQILHAKYPLF